ncbi:MAG: glucose-1-phosphate adenylyltransferase subunit GlgD, partial [Lachnospiraceae bacterium]
PARPIAGSYRLIDFALSSMSNSKIKTVAVLTQYNSRSLNQHLNSSKWWDFGSKQGSLYVFSPTQTPSNSSWYRGTADSMYQNLDFLVNRHEPYVVIASGDCIYKIDFDKVLDYHIEKDADITIITKEMKPDTNLSQYGIVQVDENNRIVDLEEKPIKPATNIASTGIYVIRRRLLIELLTAAAEEEKYDFVNDILVRNKVNKKLYSYPLDTHWDKVSDVESYFKLNKAFLDKENRDFYFKEYPEIKTKIDDNPPAKYNPGSKVSNSLVSSGCIINGVVEDSVLFKQVFIGNNVTLKNCVVLNDVYIYDNVHLENCIIEAHSTIKAGEELIGKGIEVLNQKSERYVFRG